MYYSSNDDVKIPESVENDIQSNDNDDNDDDDDDDDDDGNNVRENEHLFQKWFGITADTDYNSEKGVRVRHTLNSANEFDANYELLVGAFPSTFLLGKAYGRSCGNLSVAQINHF